MKFLNSLSNVIETKHTTRGMFYIHNLFEAKVRYICDFRIRDEYYNLFNDVIFSIHNKMLSYINNWEEIDDIEVH